MMTTAAITIPVMIAANAHFFAFSEAFRDPDWCPTSQARSTCVYAVRTLIARDTKLQM